MGLNEGAECSVPVVAAPPGPATTLTVLDANHIDYVTIVIVTITISVTIATFIIIIIVVAGGSGGDCRIFSVPPSTISIFAIVPATRAKCTNARGGCTNSLPTPEFCQRCCYCCG